MRVELGIPMRICEIALSMGGTARENSPLIRYITTDSRTASEGDLYIALKGTKYDGDDFADDLIRKRVYVVSSKNKNAHISVKNTSKSLIDFASYYSTKLPYIFKRIGITGSVGKTTTKEFAKVILSEQYKVHANLGNFNNRIGMPLSILSAPADSEILLMEMGMNHLGEISELSECLCPDIGLITNIGTSHIGNLGSREAIAKAKLEIADGMKKGKIFLPLSEPLLSNTENRLTMSLEDITADYYIDSKENSVSIYHNGIKYTEANFAFSEKHLKECLLSASALAIDIGISPGALSAGISKISEENLRNRLLNYDGYLFYADFYNASPESILASFDSVNRIKNTKGKSLLLGDVLELGEKSENIHYGIGKSIPPNLFKNIFLFGNYAEYIKKGAIENGFSKDKIHINPNLLCPDITSEQIKRFCNKGEIILMKASRGVRLERVLEYFSERG